VKQKAIVLGGTKQTRKKGEHNINIAEAKKLKREGYVKNFKMENEK
jgi:hypothetical protein